MKRAAILVLVLLASVVTGGEKERPPVSTQPAAPAENRPAEPSPLARELDALKLLRKRGERDVVDLFDGPRPPPIAVAAATHAVPPGPVAHAAAQAPPGPTPPPLPFRYLGRMQSAERSLVYLVRNQEMLIAVAGEALDKDYRVERISDSAVHLIYLPLDTPQTLSIPPSP